MSNMTKTFQFIRQGKVRDVYATPESGLLLIVASDRISAFDHVLPNTIPEKGRIFNEAFQFLVQHDEVDHPQSSG